MKKYFKYTLAVIGLLVVVLLFNAWKFGAETPVFTGESIQYEIDEEAAINRLSSAIQFQTVSWNDRAIDTAEFINFINFLEVSFPLVHTQAEKVVLGDLSLLLTLHGTNSHLKPVMFTGHYDVVPTEGGWDFEPFSGKIADGYIYGRGAIDNKNSVLGQLEAMEYLLSTGFNPERTIILAFGHDEELGGIHGASAMAEHLEENNVLLDAIFDEGGFITQGMVDGVENPVALIGIAEKRLVSFQLTSHGHAGHSSMPDEDKNAISILTQAINNIRENPMDQEITEPLEGFFENVGPHLSYFERIGIANRPLTENLVLNAFEKNAKKNALTRTTITPTVINAGQKTNTVPGTATAIINCRLLPGESVENVQRHIVESINDTLTQVTLIEDWGESPVTSYENEIYTILKETIFNTFSTKTENGAVIVSPYLTVNATDSRHYSNICINDYRFNPVPVTNRDAESIHGKNEYIKKRDYILSIVFYITMIRELSLE